nr:kinesin-like protein KIN-14N [Tanacetum cinerariifolium]
MIMGKLGNYDNKELIPCSLEQILEAKQTLQNQGWNYEMQVSIKWKDGGERESLASATSTGGEHAHFIGVGSGEF